jgi:serine protease
MVWFFRSRSIPVTAVAGAALVAAHALLGPSAQATSSIQDLQAQRALARANAFVEAARLGLNYLPGEVVVKFKPGTPVARQQRALMALRSRPDASSLEWRGDVAVLHDASQPDARILAQQLREQPEVEYASPNFIAKTSPLPRHARTVPRGRPAPRRGGWIAAPRVPGDPDYNAYQWNMTLLRMPSAWEIQDGANADILVAVVDTGVTTVNRSYTFPLWTGSRIETVTIPVSVNPDLAATKHHAPIDYVFPQTNAVVDMDGHGTHVSSTIAEEANSLLATGVAYRARIMPVKVCTSYWEIMIARAQAGITGDIPIDSGGCAFTDVAFGIRYAADNGAKVINVSLGGDGPFTPMLEAMAYATTKGAFVAVSMGNEFEEGNPVSYPARYAADVPGTMSVGAIGKNETRAYYSNTGPHNEIVAPGGEGIDDGSDNFGLIWQSTLHFFYTDPSLVSIPRFDVYDAIGYQGTSMAAPHVSGLAALIMAQRPGISPVDVERIIVATAKDLGSGGKDNEYGNGLIQPRAALFGRGIAK